MVHPVACLDSSVHPILVRMLVLVAGASGVLSTPERRFLRRLSTTLDRELDFGAIDRFVARIREGEPHHGAEPAELAFA